MEYSLQIEMIDINGNYEFEYLRFDTLEETFQAIRDFKPIRFYAVDTYKITIED